MAQMTQIVEKRKGAKAPRQVTGSWRSADTRLEAGCTRMPHLLALPNYQTT